MGSLEEIKIENEFILLRFQNDSNEIIKVERLVNQGLIQFHFGLKGKGKFVFNQGNYALDLKEEKSLLFYNPQKELPIHLELAPQSWVISVIISIKKFHGLFSSEAESIPFLSEENKDKNNIKRLEDMYRRNQSWKMYIEEKIDKEREKKEIYGTTYGLEELRDSIHDWPR